MGFIGGPRGWGNAREACPTLSVQFFFNFMQFVRQHGQSNRLAHPSLRLTLPSGKSWIRHLNLAKNIYNRPSATNAKRRIHSSVNYFILYHLSVRCPVQDLSVSSHWLFGSSMPRYSSRRKNIHGFANLMVHPHSLLNSVRIKCN